MSMLEEFGGWMAHAFFLLFWSAGVTDIPKRNLRSGFGNRFANEKAHSSVSGMNPHAL
jgi:hypothetical protein